jgi:hypothetical protein
MLTDGAIALILLFLAIIILGAIAGIIDTYLDPHCNCADKQRQERESTGAVK